MPVIDRLFADIRREADAIGTATDTRFALSEIYRTEPAACRMASIVRLLALDA